jgi:hypothetical protein
MEKHSSVSRVTRVYSISQIHNAYITSYRASLSLEVTAQLPIKHKNSLAHKFKTQRADTLVRSMVL